MKYLIFIPLLLTGMKSFSQNSRSHSNDTGTILEINPNNKGFTKTRLPYGSTVKFRITNVNPFKIEGTNSISKESISFDVPAQLSQLLSQTTESDPANIAGRQEEAENKLNKIIGAAKDSAPQGNNWSGTLEHKKGKKKLTKSQKNQIVILKKQLEILKMQKQRQDSITALKNTFITNYNGFVSTLNKLSLYTSADAYIDSLLRDTFIIDTTTLKSNLDGYMKSINDDDPDINLIRGKCKKALDDLDKYYVNAKGAYDELVKKIKNEKVILKGELGENSKNVTLKIDSAFITLVIEKIFEKEFQFLKAKYDTINSGNKRTAIVNKTNAGVDYYNRVRNAKFEVYTDAQQLNDDKITITPKLKNAKGDIIKEYNPIEIKTFGGLKVDVSTGYLLSFRGDENYTNLYDSAGIVGVQKNKTDRLKHAIGALFNAYPRTGRDINFGLSLGFSIPTDGSSIGFYGGISALMLEKNRLVVSIGMAENKVNVLNTGNLKRDLISEKTSGRETYLFSNTDFKEIKYDNVYRPAFFIGISYNLFSVKN